MAVILVGDQEVELLTPEQVLQLHAIGQLKRLIPRYEATRDPALFAQIQQFTEYLPVEDGIPMEDLWHVFQMHLLLELTKNRWIDRDDYFAAGNIFLYYSLEQAEEIVLERATAYRGPDFFVVRNVDGKKMRRRWVVWEEGGRFPDLIMEFLSASTASKDRGQKKDLYQNIFRTKEYFWYEPYSGELVGLELVEGRYQEKPKDARGWLWSEVLEAWVGVYPSRYWGRTFQWLRLFYPDGTPVPTDEEWKYQSFQERDAAQREVEVVRQQAEAAQREVEVVRQQAEAAQREAEAALRRAEQERQLREQAQAALEQLKARLRELGIEPPE